MTANRTLRLLRGALIALLSIAVTVVAGGEGEQRFEFVEPPDAAPGKRHGGLSRDPGLAELPIVTILAPEKKIGQTSRDQPVIYWHLSKSTDRPVTVTLNERKKSPPLLKTVSRGRTEAGLHKFDVADVPKGAAPLRLKRDVDYEVVVTVQVDQRGKAANPLGSARLEKADPNRVPKALSGAKDPVKLVLMYGEAGLWFDYLDALNSATEKFPGNEDLVRAWQEALAKEELWLETEEAPLGGKANNGEAAAVRK